jgi:thioredoxin-related protein
MRTLILVLSMVWICSGSYGQGIQFFEGTWKEAMAKAKQENKLLFVDSYATWCGPCIRMAKNVFTQEEVGRFFNDNFINLKLDMEKEDGVTFGHKYPVSAYPTLHWLDGDGKVIKKVRGAQQAESLINIGKEALKSNDKSVEMAELYEQGNRDYEFMLKYVKALNMAGKPSLKISNEYLNSNPKITNDERLVFLFEAAVESDSRLYDQMVLEKAKIIPLVGEDIYMQKLKKACQVSVEKSIEFESEDIFKQTLEKAEKGFPKDADAFVLRAKMKYYGTFKDTKQYFAACRSMASKFGKDDAVLAEIAMDISKNFTGDKKLMEFACDCAEDAYKLNQKQESLKFLCQIFVFGGEVADAIEKVQDAKTKAQKKGEDVSFYDGLLMFLESKKS